MKNVKPITLAIFSTLLSILIFLAACSKDDSAPKSFSINGVAYNAITFEHLTGAIIGLQPEGSTSGGSASETIETTVDENGVYSFSEVKAGTYSLYFQMSGFRPMFSNIIDLNNGNIFVAFLPVSEDITIPVGGITGIVVDKEGNAVANANIAISAQDESITNGYFSSVTSNENGQFFIGAVPLESTSFFKVRCIASGYETQLISNINILQNEMVVLYFQLDTTAPANELFYEDFEGSTNSWEMTGMWNIHPNSNIFNEAYPEYVKLAPNDNSQGRIPNAYQGNMMAWFGSPETGNYIGEQSPFDNPLSGGTSAAPNRGELVSPVINLSGLSEASFNFWSWFEIESVNPNQFGYDLMEIYVIDNGGNQTLLGKLNPYTDPILSERKVIPFTSGGFNQAPVWKYEEFDLTEYAGTSIRLKFHFDTRDGLYNGFRGWFIDEIRVTDKAALELKSAPDFTRPLMQRDS